MPKLKFKKEKERIRTSGRPDQGLRGGKIKLAGNKKGAFKYLKNTGNDSSYPDESPDVFSRLAREDCSDAGSVASSASSLASSLASSASSGFYSGSSLGSAGSVPLDRGFRVARDNPFGLDQSQLEEAEKQDILARLQTMRARGMQLSKNYTMRSSLAELRLEMGRIEHQHDTARSVARLRRWLMAGVSGAQWATNTKVAPKFVKGRLNGFSDYVLGSIEDYDSIFERMSEKYGGVLGVGSTGNPIADLFMLMGTQMLMFIFMHHKAGAKPPTEDEIRQQYPDMVRKMASELADKMRAEEKKAEQERRDRDMQFYRDQFQQQTRQSFQAPAFQPAPRPAPQMPTQYDIYQQQPPAAPPMPQVMPGPSFSLGLENEDVYDLLRPPQGQATVEELHESAAPTIEWLPQKQEEESFELPQEDATGLPQYEPPQTFPERPAEINKTVEMPMPSMGTRRGRPVKINSIQPKAAAPTKAEPKAEPTNADDGKTISIM